MKRTTIMVEEDLLYDLKQLAQQQNTSTASLIREALVAYVAGRQREDVFDNPLLRLADLGTIAAPMDIADGRDEEILRAEVHPILGWSVDHGGDG